MHKPSLLISPKLRLPVFRPELILRPRLQIRSLKGRAAGLLERNRDLHSIPASRCDPEGDSTWRTSPFGAHRPDPK